MFTREELFEYFSVQYTEEQIIGALSELAASDSSINSDAEQFPASITERLEKILQPKHKLLNTANQQLVASVQSEKIEDRVARAELFQYFGDHEPQKIEQILTKLGFEPQSQSFPFSVVEQLDKVFTVIESAIVQHKQQGLTGGLAQLEAVALELATEQTDIPTQVLAELIQVIASKAIAQGTLLGRLSNSLTDRVLEEIQVEYLTDKIGDTGHQLVQMHSILSDPDKFNQILQEHGFKSDQQLNAQIASQAATTVEFDPEQFLTEVSSPKKFGTRNLGKTPKFTTTQDIHKLTQAILKTCKQ